MTTTHHQGPLAVGNNNNNPNTLIWTTAGATPPSTAVELQDAHQETRPIVAGQLCITNTGSIYRCTDASNQAALVWQLISGAGGTIAVDPAVAGNLAVQEEDGSLVDAGTQIVLEQDPLQLTAARNRLATGVAPNTLGVGAVDLQSERNATTQVASGDYSHAEGNATTASGTASHAEGANTIASGDFSHAEGNATTASGDYSHAEGSGTQASGFASHAEGASTIASGSNSRAEGNVTTASGNFSHAGGRRAQAIQDGTYARADSLSADFPTIIADEYAVRARGGVRLVTATDGAGVPTKTTTLTTGGLWTYTDADSRNDQLAELFASIPTADPLVAGRLWSNGGIVTISGG